MRSCVRPASCRRREAAWKASLKAVVGAFRPMNKVLRAVFPQSWDILALQNRTHCPRSDSMSKIDSFRSVIELWPSPDAMAIDIGAGIAAVRKWHQRDRIPAEWWKSVLATAPARQTGLTAERMALLVARDRER